MMRHDPSFPWYEMANRIFVISLIMQNDCSLHCIILRTINVFGFFLLWLHVGSAVETLDGSQVE